MPTTTISKTMCDNHVNCGQSIEHVYKWPPEWGHVSLTTRDIAGYVNSQPIDLDLCPDCRGAVERAILTGLQRQREA